MFVIYVPSKCKLCNKFNWHFFKSKREARIYWKLWKNGESKFYKILKWREIK